jgi:hypothetical protein
VLSREELILRREHTLNVADVDDAPIGGRHEIDVGREGP